MNASPKILLKQGFANKKLLTKEIHRHYTKVFPSPTSRKAPLKIGKALLDSSDWYQEQWEHLDAIVNKPVLILWGMQDRFITPL